MSHASGNMEPMEIHGLIGAGIRAARERRGWRQEDAAQAFRRYGLTTWRRTTVADVEAGRRQPSIGDLVLVALALGVTVADLIPDSSERVEIGTDATITPRMVRLLLSDDQEGIDNLPVDEREHAPGNEIDRALETAGETAEAYTLAGQASSLSSTSATFAPPALAATELRSPTETESRVARRLGVAPAIVQTASHMLWHRTFEAERDSRVRAADDEPASAKARRRGHATRAMLAELQTSLDSELGTQQEEEETQHNADDQGD
jgi:transcriptional regulator with XRE-family HTH domain